MLVEKTNSFKKLRKARTMYGLLYCVLYICDMKAKKDGIFVLIHCVGCGCKHAISVEPDPNDAKRTVWGFNNNYEMPTFSPSLMVRTGKYVPGHEDYDDEGLGLSSICHSFITNGFMQFLPDCTHALAGQTVLLPDIENQE